jgi:mRNA-degrading endonuclease RelE of RelBE toxin-antitoxin system
MALRYAAGSRQYLASLAPRPRREMRAALRLIDEDPRHPKLDLKILRSTRQHRFYRARVGDYRIIYTIHPGRTWVWRMMHRSEGYDWLDRMDPPGQA